MITQKTQSITYYGEDQLPINITNLSNLSFVDKIYYIDQDGNYISWLDELSAHNFLQGMTTLSSGKAYTIVSKASATFPYTLFFDGDNLKEELEDARVDIDILQSNVANLGEFSIASYNEMLGASGVLREDLVAASGDLNFRLLQYVSLLQTDVATASGALREDLVTASGALREDLVTASGALREDLVTASGALKTDIVDSGIAGLEHTIAISGHLQKDIISSGHKVIDILSTALNDTKEEITDLITDRPRYYFDVTVDNADPNLANAYRFAGVGITTSNQDNPTLYLRRGETYLFRVNSPNHPFYIKTENVIGTQSIYNEGVTNNGYTDRNLTFEVPYNAPTLLYYQCSNHEGMHGLLYTLQPTYMELVDGGRPGSFGGATTTTAGPGGGDEVFDTTLEITTGNNVSVNGLTFTAGVGDSISFTALTDDGSDINPTFLFLFTDASATVPVGSLVISATYRNSANNFQVTIGGTEYGQIALGITGDVYLTGIRVNLS